MDTLRKELKTSVAAEFLINITIDERTGEGCGPLLTIDHEGAY